VINMTNEKLNELIALHDAIYLSDCFGIYDIIRYNILLNDLKRKGYKISERQFLHAL